MVKDQLPKHRHRERKSLTLKLVPGLERHVPPRAVMKKLTATPPRWSYSRGYISSLRSRLLAFLLLAFLFVLVYDSLKDKMRFSHPATLATLTTLLSLLPSSLAQSAAGPDQDGKYVVTGTNIRATFIPYGASISNLFINDTSGVERDIVGGWDNATYYGIDRQHPHFGGIPGRYANRIKNSSFVIDGTTYNILPNENPEPGSPNGVDTLHGGPDGWDWRNWTLIAHTTNSITFSLTDPDGDQGFPGEVIAYVTYTLGNMTWDFTMVAMSTEKKTPIMMSSHTYWNLDGYANPDTPLVLNHSLHMPYAGQRTGADAILIPTGDILPNKNGSVNDFWTQPKEIGASFGDPAALGNCGTNCTGYDTCFINTRLGPYGWKDNPVARLSSAWSGIAVSVFTDQDAFQLYSCGGQNGSVALKQTQGLFDVPGRERVIEQHGCVVMEVQDWIDGINNPEWGRKQIWGPDDGAYQLRASYQFSLDG